MIEPLIGYEVNEMMENVLHIAVSFSQKEIVEFLMQQDCSSVLVSAKDIKGQTPLDLARKSKQKDIHNILMGLQQVTKEEVPVAEIQDANETPA